MMPKKELMRRKIVRKKQISMKMKRSEKVITTENTKESIENTVMEIKKIIKCLRQK